MVREEIAEVFSCSAPIVHREDQQGNKVNKRKRGSRGKKGGKEGRLAITCNACIFHCKWAKRRSIYKVISTAHLTTHTHTHAHTHTYTYTHPHHSRDENNSKAKVSLSWCGDGESIEYRFD